MLLLCATKRARYRATSPDWAWRSLWPERRGETGEQRTARLLSAHTTCRLQRRSLFVYLTDALTAHARGDPVPLLT